MFCFFKSFCYNKNRKVEKKNFKRFFRPNFLKFFYWWGQNYGNCNKRRAY